jgi:hypothetical protein
MGRFVATTTTTTAYTRAEVFSTPGTSSWTVPAGVTKAKVFVIGAGSCYRVNTMCFQGLGCYSGNSVPICNYCLTFQGHLPGAGGAYAEKTLTDIYPSQVMTINVGSPTGLSASSISIGSNTVTAGNGTETAVSWNCTNNTTARVATSDNPFTLGFPFPTCGYYNYISGYWNSGGTASGGDINRSGGRGTIAPYFCQNSCMDVACSAGSSGVCLRGCTTWACNNSGYDYSFGGTRYNCNCFNGRLCPCNNNNCYCGSSFYVDQNCICLITYHNVFGGQCYYFMPWTSCVCQAACNNGMSLCVSNAGAAGGPGFHKYFFAGCAQRASTGTFGNDPQEPSTPYSTNVEAVPAGIGAESGRSDGPGLNGLSEVQITQSSGSYTASSGGSTCYGTGTVLCCKNFNQDHFSFYFGSNLSQFPWVGFMDIGNSGGSAGASSIKCYNIGFNRDASLYRPTNPGVLPLSQYKSSTGSSVADIKYGYGATINPAGYGGGGNRLNPGGGGGLVVVVY